MKFLTAILVSIALSGCVPFSKPTEYRIPPKPDVTDMGTFSQKVHFIELMEVVRDNWHQAPTPELKVQVARLMQEAGLRQECANKRCWLQYQQIKITTNDDFIIIEPDSKNVVKIDINEPHIAAKMIYG